MKIQFFLNREPVIIEASATEMVLDILRNRMHLTSVKEGCREGDCGACTILMGRPSADAVHYQAVTSCLLPAAEIDGCHVVTLEGLNGPELNPVQAAFLKEGAVQCGFCTPGILLSLTAYFLSDQMPSADEAAQAISGHICRCTGYLSIRRAVEGLLCGLPQPAKGNRLDWLIEKGIVPGYFREVHTGLKSMPSPQDQSINPPGSSRFIAGGTDLFVHPPEDLDSRGAVFIHQQEEAHLIRETRGFLELGAGVTVEALRESPLVRARWPKLPQLLTLVSSPQIRNRATLAGNMVNASPIGDLSIILLALEAELELSGPAGTRRLSLDHFFLGYKKMDLKSGEMIRLVRVPLPAKDSAFHFEKVSRRRYLDIAGVNSALQITLQQGRIEKVVLSAGGVAPIPLVLSRTAAFLQNRRLNPDTISQALGVMDEEIAPISDVRGSAEYKRRLLHHLLAAHFITLYPQWFNPDAGALRRILGGSIDEVVQ